VSVALGAAAVLWLLLMRAERPEGAPEEQRAV